MGLEFELRGVLPAIVLLAFALSPGHAASRTDAHGQKPAAAPKWVREEGSIDTMGTLIAVVAYGPDANKACAAISDALDEAARLDAMLSNYKPDSEWSKVNRLAAEKPVSVSAELFRLLTACETYSRESAGAFDISVGPLMEAWGFYKHSGRLPGRAEVLRALNSVGYRNIILDPQTRTVRFARRGVELDPGGIGKGYTVDRMVDVLRKDGIPAALVSAGGSSIYALGAPPGKKGWCIDLEKPPNSSGPAQSVTLRDESLSTSGNYEKFFYAAGKRWSHIMDPRTGYPSRGVISVSVVSPKTIDSEAWAKPYYILGPKWTAEHKKSEFRVFMCEDKPGASCTWIQ